MASQEIVAVKTVHGNTEKIRSIIEKAGQTFIAGTPVQVDSGDGGIKEWAGTVGTDLIAGFCTQDANNLASTGLGAPNPNQPITGTGAALTYGSVPGQSSAKKFPRGAPMVDGRILFAAASEETVFEGNVGPAQTTVAADVGKSYGITKDADNHWYIDRTKTGANAVVRITALHPLDGPKLAGRVWFQVEDADTQIVG